MNAPVRLGDKIVPAALRGGVRHIEAKKPMAGATNAKIFLEARRLRDRINLLRGGATSEQADTSGLARQKSGAMGIGSSQANPITPEGWQRPRKPDPMTSGQSRKRR